jgi:hypothetical protein
LNVEARACVPPTPGPCARDVDEEVAHRGANVDLSALHALVDEVQGCGTASWCPPVDLGEIIVPKEIALLRKGTFTSRLGKGGAIP